MARIVLKFGGTSVADIERIQHVARKVAAVREQGDDVVVVVSAMAGETDKLLGYAQQICPSPNGRDLDLLLSSGERVTTALLSMALQAIECKARSFTGRQVGLRTDGAHTRARIREIGGERLERALRDGEVAVVAGFQGIDEEEDVTTLGRGGSDTSAVALAAALNAERCEIYTDVEGVYSADPNVVPGARLLERISYEEMLELASLGAKVLHARSVEFAKKYDVPVYVRSTFKEGKGTLVTREDAEMERVLVSGVTQDKNQVKVTLTKVPDRPGIAAQVFGRIAEASIVVDVIVQNISEQGLTDISFTVPRSDLPILRTFIQEIRAKVGAEEVKINEDIAKVSIVGVGMRGQSGVAAKMFHTLAQENINIHMISTSEIKISCIIDNKYSELALRILHDAFEVGRVG